MIPDPIETFAKALAEAFKERAHMTLMGIAHPHDYEYERQRVLNECAETVLEALKAYNRGPL